MPNADIARRVLVTGAGGFVGSAICDGFSKAGWTVTGLGRRPNSRIGYIQADLTKRPVIDSAPAVVVHAAARSSPWGSLDEFQLQNVEATRFLIDWCRNHGKPHLIYISTGAVLYTNEHQLGLREDAHPPSVSINHYAKTKLAAEQLVRNYEGKFTIVRPRAVFGPKDTVVFPRLLRALRKGRLPIFKGAEPVWADLIYIDNLADYIVKIGDRAIEGLFHLSNGEPVEITSFIAKLALELGYPQPSRTLSIKTALRLACLTESLYKVFPFLGEPPLTRFGISVMAFSKTFDTTKAFSVLGPPAISLEEGRRRFVEWCRFEDSKRNSSRQ